MNDDAETAIATALVDHALDAGYSLTVDGMPADHAAALEAILGGTTTRLVLDTTTGRHWLLLRRGRGADMIADYAGPDEVMVPLLEAAQNAVDRCQT